MNKINIFYAHSLDGKAADERHPPDEHLKGTAELAGSFAAEFGCSEWGWLAGLWHDAG
ncbi:MAG: hypothetical protein HY034_02315 [Nitrospirae bacterium]|nr:hypothetical protein [Nitrospirota bacterium]